jgi:endonuclease YncB( thermonuclease family)
MRAFFITALMFLMGCNTLQPQFTPEPNQVLKGKASYVIDGDTFYFSYDKGKFKSKIMGAGSPGISDKGGFEAYEYLRKLIHQQDVEIQYINTDNENRWVINAKLESGEDVAEKIRNHLSTLSK